MLTIASTLRATARRVPDTTALRFAGRVLTYAELDVEVDKAANALAALGLSRGDRFALMGANSDAFVIAFYAGLRLGAVCVPVNPALAAPELRYVLADSGAAVLAFDPAVAGVVDVVGPDCRTVALGAVPGHGNLFAAAADPTPVEDSGGDTVAESDDALILYTSGTTGDPKGAVFDHRRMLWTMTSAIATCGMRVGDRFLHVAPLYHAAQLCMMLIPGTAIGATHVIHQGFAPTKVLDAMEDERITMFFGVPTMFQFLLREPTLRTRDLSAWRTGLFGAAPMPASAVAELIEALPGVDLVQLAGQTEAGPGGIYADAAQVRARPDASGRQAIPFWEVRVVDAGGHDVKAGAVGEVLLRGAGVMKGYWNKPAETADTLRDGWLHTGDLGLLDADGYITFVDRMKDMIISGGRNVYSAEVERVLAACPGVLDCAVVARPHPDFGESIVAVVTPHDGATVTLEGVREFCAERIAHYKIPHDLVIGPIPRNPSGKILKHRLRERLLATAEE